MLGVACQMIAVVGAESSRMCSSARVAGLPVAMLLVQKAAFVGCGTVGCGTFQLEL